MQKYLIRNITVVNEGVSSVRDVLIEKGRIAKIDSVINADSNAREINGEGKHLLPGVIDDQEATTRRDPLSSLNERSGTFPARPSGFDWVAKRPLSSSRSASWSPLWTLKPCWEESIAGLRAESVARRRSRHCSAARA